MRYIGYMRISTNCEKQNTDLQKDALISAGVKEVDIFTDYSSGAKRERHGLEKALAACKSGDCLVVWKLDRLGRSLSHLIEIINSLRERSVAFRSLTESVDTTTAHGELLFNLFGAFAQYERELIRERVNAGLEAAKKRGTKLGRPRTITSEQLEEAKRMIETGTATTRVAKLFNVNRSTLTVNLQALACQ